MEKIIAKPKKIDRLKKHFKDNKKTYIVGGVCLVVGVGIGAVIFRGHGSLAVSNKQGIAILSPIHNNITNTTNVVRRGHAGNVVRCIETGEEFASQSRAAELLKVPASSLSKHLKGLSPHVKGMTFEVVDDFHKESQK